MKAISIISVAGLVLGSSAYAAGNIERAIIQQNSHRVVQMACTCAAGKLAILLSELPGAAEHLEGGFVPYTKANKARAARGTCRPC